MSKFCHQCGEKLKSEESNFCDKCGAKVDEDIVPIKSSKNSKFKNFKISKKILLLVIILILIIGFCMILFNSGGNIDPSSLGKTIIKIHSDNPNVSGKMTIYEYSGIESNSNGTYNMSQFGDYYGLLGFYSMHAGSTQDIVIQNGESEYEIPAGVDVIFAYPYLTDISGEGNITVELYVNGVKKFSSYSDIYASQYDLSWGDQLIKVDGTAIPNTDLIPDTPHNFVLEGY